jgi:hypothetical protein
MEKQLLPENFLNILSNIYEHFMTYRKNFLLPGFLPFFSFSDRVE